MSKSEEEVAAQRGAGYLMFMVAAVSGLATAALFILSAWATGQTKVATRDTAEVLVWVTGIAVIAGIGFLAASRRD